MKAWGYWATLGWGVLAFLLAQFIALGVLVWWQAGDMRSILEEPFDGAQVTLFLFISNPITVAVIALAVRLKGARFADYLALNWPAPRQLVIGAIGLVALIAVSDVLLYLSGRDLVSPFQVQSYNSAVAEGWLFPLLIGVIIVGPGGEEILFRGFLFRGWARAERSVWPAIVVTSLLWAALHVQYDWTGILQIFVIGLFLGWLRWTSGSTLLTFILHALFNLEGTMETVLRVKFYS